MSTSSIARSITVCFANSDGFSGQKAAFELLLDGLTRRGWSCQCLYQPVWRREIGGWRSLVWYGTALMLAWARTPKLVASRRSAVVVGLGQTPASFLRDAPALVLARLRRAEPPVIIALHGSVFMQWSNDSLASRCFKALLAQADLVTVLGERQRDRLVALGVPPRRVRILVNTCRVAALTPEAAERKHAAGDAAPLRLLYLSSLIDTKGYPEYLQALRDISRQPGPPVEAVLCGRVLASEFAERFRTVAEAESWIERTIEEINGSGSVRISWIRGAVGAAKEELFHSAHVFVLPTRYAVEAQPLVLLEAMASGCAIATTAVGEIPTILDAECAVFLDPTDGSQLRDQLQHLRVNPARRRALGLSALARYLDSYQPERHLDEWERLLAERRREKGRP